MSINEEPSMLIQRPSSGHCQETSHILVSSFRDLYTQDSIDADTVRHLAASKNGDHSYHDRYVERLQKIQHSWSKKVHQSEKILAHLEDAHQKARSMEEEELQKEICAYKSYERLGLPPVTSKLHRFLDKELLGTLNLIMVDNFMKLEEFPPVRSERSQVSTPQYMQSTISSKMHVDKSHTGDNYLPEPEPMLPVDSYFSKNNFHPTKKKMTRKPTVPTSNKNIWRECINPHQRELEKKAIVNLQKKADFLKNPRFDSSPKSSLVISSKSVNKGEKPVQFFQAFPSPVIFLGYEADYDYEIKLELRNVTSSCRHVRVVDPTTPYFSISHGSFPSDSGLVAPGMSCFYTIKFSPDSLANFDDYLEVQTQASAPLLIKLQARRQTPVLTLPTTLNCGPALVGDVKHIEYNVLNQGGTGKFIFKLQNHEEDENLEEENQQILWDEVSGLPGGYLHEETFQLSPSQFSLEAGEHLKIMIVFKPEAAKIYSHNLILFCDNFTQQKYSIEGIGELVNVKMVDITGGVFRPEDDDIDETFDLNTVGISRFQHQNPNVKNYKEIKIENNTSVYLKYHWEILIPSVGEQNEVFFSPDSVFSIHPRDGFLEKNATTTFSCQFFPQEVGSFYDVASLVLEDIPKKNDDDETFENKEISTLQISLKGKTQPFKVFVDPPVVFFNDRLHIDQPYTQIVKEKGTPQDVDVKNQLHNESYSTATFKWMNFKDDICTVSAQPSHGEIDVNGFVECHVTVIGHNPGKLRSHLNYEIPYTTTTRGLYMEGRFVGPDIRLDNVVINMNLLQFGHYENRILTLQNHSPILARWNIKETKQENPDVYFEFYPADGIIEGYSERRIAMHYRPLKMGIIDSIIECQVERGNSCYAAIHSIVQQPIVQVEQQKLYIDETFLHVPVIQKITLINTTKLIAKFQWNKQYGCNDELFTRSFQPESGVLEGEEKIDIEITITCHSLGTINILSCCDIAESNKPVFLSISTVVQGLAVDYTVPNMEDVEGSGGPIRTSKVIDFGENVMLGTPVSCLFLLENKSAINSTFQITMKSFPIARLPTPPSKEKNSTGTKKKNRPLLLKTANIADYDSKTDEQAKKDYIGNVLRDGNGLAFLCTPDHGELHEFEKKIITVTAFSDMWGEYQDTLVCKVGDLDELCIPVHIDIIGSPLKFQMSKEQPPLVRFGSHVSGSSAIHRSLKLNNTSHVDIRLDWSSYVIDPSDERLIDLSMYYGNPLPKLNDDGNEISPSQDDDDDDDDEPLIKVFMSEHHGTKNEKIFNVLTKQIVIPALNHRNVSVTFTPLSNQYEDDEINYLGYALAHMTLNKKVCKYVAFHKKRVLCKVVDVKIQDKRKDSCFNRLDGLEMLPLAINLNGGIKQAKLYMEPCMKGGFHFELAATELLASQKPVVDCIRRFILYNNSGTTVSFTCQIEKPFRLLYIDTGKEKVTSINKNIALKSRKNVEISISFECNLELATKYVNLNEITKPLEIQFSNGIKQCYDFRGVINYPSLSLHSTIIDFEKCYVNHTKEKSLRIFNPSKAPLFWRIKYAEKQSESSREVFQFSPNEGQIEGCYEQSFAVKVAFKPSHNVKYECILSISSTFHEDYLNTPPICVTLIGLGSYDENYSQLE